MQMKKEEGNWKINFSRNTKVATNHAKLLNFCQQLSQEKLIYSLALSEKQDVSHRTWSSPTSNTWVKQYSKLNQEIVWEGQTLPKKNRELTDPFYADHSPQDPVQRTEQCQSDSSVLPFCSLFRVSPPTRAPRLIPST